MRPVRLGAVSYLNTKPLVHGLDRRPDLFDVRFDVPSECAALLHAGRIDVGLIPAIEYLHDEYRIVPGVAIGSDGPVHSVAIFSARPLDRARTIALDTSSRTSAALTRILCAKHFGIAPAFVSAPPDLRAMLALADAALLIGDPALHADTAALGLQKTDLGAAWHALTGLPFVYAMWTGRAGAVGSDHVTALNEARDAGRRAVDAIADAHGAGDGARTGRARRYLRDILRFGLGDAECAGLRRFHELAVELSLAPGPRTLRFYE
jgi:chorismate dehydratase